MDDNEINLEIETELLQELGFCIETAPDGLQAIEKLQASTPGEYAFILMDIQMPVMNGYDATVAIRSLNRADVGLPIIAMTADAFSDDAQHCIEVGMDAHIPKPLDVKECMCVLSKFLQVRWR